MTARTAIPLPLDELRDICRRYGIVRLEVFGSILRDDFGPTSDIDFLCTLTPEADEALSLWDLGELIGELEDLLGRPVDLGVRADVEETPNPYRRKAILESAEVLLELAPAP